MVVLLPVRKSRLQFPFGCGGAVAHRLAEQHVLLNLWEVAKPHREEATNHELRAHDSSNVRSESVRAGSLVAAEQTRSRAGRKTAQVFPRTHLPHTFRANAVANREIYDNLAHNAPDRPSIA